MKGIIDGRNGSEIVGTNTAAKQGVPDARFTATTINYDGVTVSMGTNPDVAPNGGDTSVLNADNSQLYKFLSFNGNGDSASIVSEAGIGKTTDAGFRITGNIYLEPGNYDFNVVSDDGFRLMIDGQSVAQYDNNKSRNQIVQVEDVAIKGGLMPVELLYWEQGHYGVLNFQYKKTGTTEWQTLDLTQSLMLKSNDIEFNVIQDAVKVGQTWAKRTGSLLDGSTTAETIVGSAGRDLIFGDAGNDKMTGGTGADTFVFSTTNDNDVDVITDFTVGSDKIALSSIVSLSEVDLDSPNWLNANSVNNLTWNDTAKSLSYQTEDGGSNTITFQGMTNSYTNADAFLAENLATSDSHAIKGSVSFADLSLSNLTDYATVDLSGAGADSLTDVTLANLVSTATKTLYVQGDASDTVDLGATGKNLTDAGKTWTKGAATEVDGVTYDAWTADNDKVVYIEQGINVI